MIHGEVNLINDIIYIGIVTTARVISVHLNGLVIRKESDKFVDAHLGTLAGAVDGEKVEVGDVHPVLRREYVVEKLTGEFGCGIGADGLGEVHVLMVGRVGEVCLDTGGETNYDVADIWLQYRSFDKIFFYRSIRDMLLFHIVS